MLASAGRTYLNHYGVAVGRKVGIYTSNDSAYYAAVDLKKAGVNVAAIIDARQSAERDHRRGAFARHHYQDRLCRCRLHRTPASPA